MERPKYLDFPACKWLPKARVEQRSYMSRNTIPEYRYINYDLDLIKQDYERVSTTIMEMQMALDKYNQTVQFDVDIRCFFVVKEDLFRFMNSYDRES